MVDGRKAPKKELLSPFLAVNLRLFLSETFPV